MFCELVEEPESEGRKEQVVKVDMQTDEDTWWLHAHLNDLHSSLTPTVYT